MLGIKRVKSINTQKIPIDTIYNFGYTGGIQTFTVPCNGIYQLAVWGGKGGNGGNNDGAMDNGGRGGYSLGYIYLKKSEILYIVCGGVGSSSMTNEPIPGGYNGGAIGNGYPWHPYYSICGGGGGATHIARVTGLLSSLASTYTDNLLIVAGGGGGAGGTTAGGAGGGLSGGGSNPGTQTGGGGTFGQGAHSSYAGGGGGGFYGGLNDGGGSGYIGGVPTFTSRTGNTYTPSTTAGQNNSTGRATIRLVAYR